CARIANYGSSYGYFDVW
nr:immunoglobulin heavy chain junction region [Mus musculus]